MAIYCPTCHSNDRVQKVTAIVAKGTWSEMRYSGNPYTGWYNTTNSSELVKNLLYDEPKKKTTWGCLGCFGMFFLCGWAFIFLAASWFDLAGQLNSGKPISSNSLSELLIPAVFGGLALLFLIVQIVRGIKNKRRYQADYARWQNDFDRRYYCYRDDLVFYGNP